MIAPTDIPTPHTPFEGDESSSPPSDSPRAGDPGTDRDASWDLEEPGIGTEDSLESRAAQGRLDQPGAGRTEARFRALAAASRRSLGVGRLVEAHADGQSILLEAGWTDPEALGLLGVWASDRSRAPVRIEPTPDGLVLRGTKAFCSGAPLVDHALVTAASDEGVHLCIVDVRGAGVQVEAARWVGLGMREAATRSVRFDDAPVVEVVGAPGWYLERPGFWHGAVGVAASWYGGALGVLATMRAGVGADDAHPLAHLGEADAIAYAAGAALERAARAIDRDPTGFEPAHRRALQVRRVVADGCLRIIEHSSGALGPRGLAFDADHAQRVVDLDLYVRQDHGRQDSEQLGRLVSQEGPAC